MLDISRTYKSYQDVPEEVKKRWAGMIAESVKRIADRHSYGLGECGYYFNEQANEQLDYGVETHTDSDARQLANQAEEVAEFLEEHDL